MLEPDPAVRRLRWVMVASMAITFFNMLAGQPKSYWLDPRSAIRGDGLGIHSPVNPSFDFLLGHGWPAFTAAFAAYGAIVFFVVTILPRTASLISIFSILFGHCFSSCNWIGTRWQLGFSGVTLFCFLLGLAISAAGAPFFEPSSDRFIRRVRWVMAAAIFADALVTLVGQPGSYWLHPETVHEGNSMSRWFMLHGWGAYVLMDLVYCLVALWLVALLPRFFATACLWMYVLGHFVGASNWFFYDWRLGWETPLAYGVFLSSVIVFLSRGPAEQPAGIKVRPALCW